MKDYDSRLGIYSTEGGLFRRLSIKLTNNYIQVKKINNLDLKNLSSFNYLLISFLDNTDTLDDFIKICDKIESKILVLIPLYVDEARMENVKRARHAVIRAEFSTVSNTTSCNGQHLKIYSDYTMGVTLTARFNYKVQTKF